MIKKSKLFSKSKDISQLAIFEKHRQGLDKFFESEKKIILESSRNDAINNPPSKEIESSISKLPEFVRTKNSHLEKLSKANTSIKGVLDSSYSDYESTIKKIADLESDNIIGDFKTNKQEATSDLKADFTKEENERQSELSEERNNLKNHNLDLKGRIKYLTFWRIFFCCLALGITAFCEVFYTASAFEITGLAYLERHLISVGLSLSCLFVGVGCIELIKSKKLTTIWKIVSSVGLSVLIASVFYVLGELRVSLVEIDIESSGVAFSSISPFGFMLISLIFYVAIILIHWLIWPPKKHFKENRVRKSIQDRIKKSEKKIANLSKEIKAIPIKRRKEVAQSNKEFDKAKKDFNKDLEYLKKQRDESIELHNNTYGRVVAFVEEIDSHFKSMVGLYISTMNRYRKDGAFLVVPEIESLPNPFKDFSYISNTNNSLDTTVDNQSNNPVEPTIDIQIENLLNN